jgi:hypothetical protein
MSDGGSSDGRPVYQIKVEGQLPERWSDWFNGLAIMRETASGGVSTTTLTGPVADQAALHGILNRIRDLNVKLISVNQVESGNP